MFTSTYSYKFLRHIEKFMDEMKLFPSSGKLIVGCSTGLDSMVLLSVARHLLAKGKIKYLEVAHLNHQTRPECDAEEAFIREFCEQAGITLHVKTLHKRPVQSNNFEAWAREKRYEFFHELLNTGDRLATAHHLDDSFEWWLMQNLKTSNPEIVGIPAQNHKIIRPFLCVTREQIERFSLKNDLKYFTDKSNFDVNFERNYLREVVISQLKRKYPKYLKHYALRSNETLKLRAKKKIKDVRIIEDKNFGIHLYFEETPSVTLLSKLIQKVSSSEKGSIRAELVKLVKSLENGGQGPMDFSGGVKIYFNRTEMLILHRDQMKNYLALDEQLTKNLQKNHLQGLKGDVQKVLSSDFLYPRLIITPDDWVKEKVSPIKSIHPLFPQMTRFLLGNSLWFCSANQLKQLCLKRPEFFQRQISIINLQQTTDLT